MGHPRRLPLSEPPSYTYEAYTHRPSSRRQRLAGAIVLVLAVLGAAYVQWPLRTSASSQGNQALFQDGLQKCAAFEVHPSHEVSNQRRNLRWNSATGQQKTTLLRNATLFDGEHFLEQRVDVLFSRGVVKSVTFTASGGSTPDDVEVVDLHGKYVTPGIVDMHSHHLVWPFHSLPAIKDVNETPLLGPLTPFVRSIDGMKAYDPAIEVIAGGGVTTSLILPGSSNIIGGEAYIVKNAYLSGKDREPVVDDLLLDHGLPESQRQRYVKMACGENPKHTYLHTRLGNAWLLREHFAEAKAVLDQQDRWCQAASSLANRRFTMASEIDNFVKETGSLPHLLKYDTTIAMLRGQANVNIHCYEPEDFERMLSVLHEFGVHPRAFHHALEAWQVPEFLKKQEKNITIATFAENAFFKAEAYGASLRAGKILNDHNIPVAYKSDHTGEGNNAKYVLHQAAIAHSFGLPLDKALQSVTSVPARSLQQDHRVGFVRPGYDADIVVWDSHPLAIGATAVQVYIDGKAILSPESVTKTLEKVQYSEIGPLEPKMRATVSQYEKLSFCDKVQHGKVIFTGIKRNFLDRGAAAAGDTAFGNRTLTLVLDRGKLLCLGLPSDCTYAAENSTIITLKDGYVLPGLTAVSSTLGLVEIAGEPSTSDGVVEAKSGGSGSLDYAKYGVELEGRGLGRARIGGITRAVVSPLLRGGLIKGVSVAYRTSGKRTVLDGGIVKEDVAVHFELSEASKGTSSQIRDVQNRLILTVNSQRAAYIVWGYW